METKLKNYRTAQDLLVDLFSEKKRRNPRFSLRSWSKQLGYKNPSLISDVLQGRRNASSDLLLRVAADFRLNKRDEEILLNFIKSSSGKKPSKSGRLKDNALASQEVLDLDKFRVISDWYHLAILEMFLLKDFNCDPRCISESLIGGISRSEAALALERLERIGLLERDLQLQLRPSAKAGNIFAGCKGKDAGIINHHKQFANLALEAIDSQDLDERDFSGLNVAIRKSDYPKILEAIYEFLNTVNKYTAARAQGEAVYRLNIQLFRLDKKRST